LIGMTQPPGSRRAVHFGACPHVVVTDVLFALRAVGLARLPNADMRQDVIRSLLRSGAALFFVSPFGRFSW
jgi:hypothetical protein